VEVVLPGVVLCGLVADAGGDLVDVLVHPLAHLLVLVPAPIDAGLEREPEVALGLVFVLLEDILPVGQHQRRAVHWQADPLLVGPERARGRAVDELEVLPAVGDVRDVGVLVEGLQVDHLRPVRRRHRVGVAVEAVELPRLGTEVVPDLLRVVRVREERRLDRDARLLLELRDQLLDGEAGPVLL